MAKDHKLESRKREIFYSVCVEPGCKFNGKDAAQGVCFSKLSTSQSKYVEGVLKQGQHCLDEMKALRKKNGMLKKDAWLKYMENSFVCQLANDVFHLDELVHLRAENAKLKLALGKWKKGQ